jgi:hypothetical protein
VRLVLYFSAINPKEGEREAGRKENVIKRIKYAICGFRGKTKDKFTLNPTKTL